MTPEQRDDTRERIAEKVYEAMKFEREEDTPTWVPGGNSFAQTYARGVAIQIMEIMEEKT